MTSELVGTYYVLRYIPDLVRDEPVNLGVILCLPGEPRPLFRLPESVKQLERGNEVGQETLQWIHRILCEARDQYFALATDQHAVDVPSFLDKLGNHFRLTPPRSWVVIDPDAALDELFESYVNVKRTASKMDRHLNTSKVRQRIDRIFKRTGASARIRSVTRLGLKTQVPVSAHWAWLNGAMHFAEAISLETGDYPTKEYMVRALVQKAEELTPDPTQYFTVFIALPRHSSPGLGDVHHLERLLHKTCQVIDYRDAEKLRQYVERVNREGVLVDNWPSPQELDVLA